MSIKPYVKLQKNGLEGEMTTERKELKLMNFVRYYLRI